MNGSATTSQVRKLSMKRLLTTRCVKRLSLCVILLATIIFNGCTKKTYTKENFDYSTLSSKVYFNDLDFIEKARQKGASLQLVNQWGNNLMFSVTSADMVYLLAASGVDVNQQSNNYTDLHTPLHIVVIGSNMDVEVVKAMIKVGANPNIKDRFGKKPVDYAKELMTQYPNAKGYEDKYYFLHGLQNDNFPQK